MNAYYVLCFVAPLRELLLAELAHKALLVCVHAKVIFEVVQRIEQLVAVFVSTLVDQLVRESAPVEGPKNLKDVLVEATQRPAFEGLYHSAGDVWVLVVNDALEGFLLFMPPF